jgi:hypothetical protein
LAALLTNKEGYIRIGKARAALLQLKEASTGGLQVPEGLYSPVAKYFGTWFKIRI